MKTKIRDKTRDNSRSGGSDEIMEDGQAVALIYRNRGESTEEEMIIAATDTKGHTETIWFRVQPAYLRECKMILAERRFPWKSIGDLMRFALDQTVRWAVREKELKHSILPQIDMINQMVREDLMQRQMMQTFEDMEQTLEKKGPRAKRLANLIWEQIKKMPDGYWKDQYKQEFKRRYKELLGGVRLSETVEDEIEEDD